MMPGSKGLSPHELAHRWVKDLRTRPDMRIEGRNEETLCNSRMRGNMEDFQDFQIIDNCLMVRMPEEVDHHRASYICEGADRLLVRENVENVVFDFEDTRFMDSSGIGIIMGRYRKISCFGGHVYAIHTDRQIQRIFRMSGLHKIVEILPG